MEMEHGGTLSHDQFQAQSPLALDVTCRRHYCWIPNTGPDSTQELAPFISHTCVQIIASSLVFIYWMLCSHGGLLGRSCERN